MYQPAVMNCCCGCCYVLVVVGVVVIVVFVLILKSMGVTLFPFCLTRYPAPISDLVRTDCFCLLLAIRKLHYNKRDTTSLLRPCSQQRQSGRLKRKPHNNKTHQVYRMGELNCSISIVYYGNTKIERKHGNIEMKLADKDTHTQLLIGGGVMVELAFLLTVVTEVQVSHSTLSSAVNTEEFMHDEMVRVSS